MQRNLFQSADDHRGIASCGPTSEGAPETIIFIPALAEIPDEEADYNDKDSSGDDAHQQHRYVNLGLGITLSLCIRLPKGICIRDILEDFPSLLVIAYLLETLPFEITRGKDLKVEAVEQQVAS